MHQGAVSHVFQRALRSIQERAQCQVFECFQYLNAQTCGVAYSRLSQRFQIQTHQRNPIWRRDTSIEPRCIVFEKGTVSQVHKVKERTIWRALWETQNLGQAKAACNPSLLVGPLSFDFAPLSHVPIVLSQCGRKRMPTGAVRHKENVFGAVWIGGSL